MIHVAKCRLVGETVNGVRNVTLGAIQVAGQTVGQSQSKENAVIQVEFGACIGMLEKTALAKSTSCVLL